MRTMEDINREGYLASYQLWSSFRLKLAHEINASHIDLYEKTFFKFLELQKSKLQKLITSLENLDGSKKAVRLAEQITCLKELAHKIDAIESSFEKPFSLFVIGLGKVGKSTLLNALIRQNVAAIDSLPKTWKTDLFWKSTESQVRICYRDGSEKLMTHQSAQQLVDDEECKREASEDESDKQFKKQSTGCKTIEEKEELKKELYHQYVYCSPVREVQWPITTQDEKSILNKFTLIDTPGLWQSHTGAHKEDIGDFYHQADGILWVLDAMTLSARKPKEMYEQLEAALTRVGVKKAHNVVAVLNRIDRVRENAGEDMISKVIHEAKSIFNGMFLDIIPYSAKEAFGATQKGEVPPSSSGHTELLSAIDHFFYTNALKLRIDGKISSLQALISLTAADMSIYTAELQLDNKKRNTLCEQLNSDLSSLKTSLQQDLNILIKSISDKISKNIDNKTETFLEIENDNTKERFFRDEIIDITKVESKIASFQTTCNERYNLVRKEYLKKSTFTEYKYVNRKNEIAKATNTQIMERQSINLNTDVNDASDISGVIISGVGVLLLANPIGLALGLIAYKTGLTKWIGIKFNLKPTRKKFNEYKQTLLSSAEVSIDRLFDKLASSVKNDVDGIRESTFAELHSSSAHFNVLMKIPNQLTTIAESRFHQISLVDILMERDAHELARMV